MLASNSFRGAVLVALLSVPLLMGNRGCSQDDSSGTNGGGSGSHGDAGAGDGRAGACKPDDCKEVPAIACADGPTEIVCERDASGTCRARIRCGGADGGAGEGQKCAGFAGVACADGLFCNVEKAVGGDGCGDIADGQGVCQKQPDACGEIYAPVCGCDYRSYANACEAHAKAISVLHDGLCTYAECEKIGGRVVTSDGASTPSCNAGEDSYQVPGIEPALCCVPAAGTSELKWYETCGDPVCSGHRDLGLPKCTTQKQGAPCTESGTECDPGNECNALLRCAASDPTQGPGGCPISRARFKTDLEYLNEADLARYHEQVMKLGIARYRYRDDPSRQERLGFIIEDVEPSVLADEARDRVDLYAYTSAVVAAMQVQEKHIRALEAQVHALEARLAHTTRKR